MLPAAIHTLLLCIATTVTATATTRSPYEAARQQAAAAAEREHTRHRFMAGGQMQQILHPHEEEIDEDRILTVTRHQTAYRVNVVTEYREAPTSTVVRRPVATPVDFIPSFYRPELECEAAICDRCVDWLRCDNGVSDCFVCKTAPSHCRCNPPRDLVRGATVWDRTHSHDDFEKDSGYIPSRHSTICTTSNGREIPCDAMLAEDDAFMMDL